MWAWLEPLMSWGFIIGIACWLLYAGMIKPVINPTPTNTQTGGVSYNIKTGFGGCTRVAPTVTPTINPLTNEEFK
jgi:hypothetical protein